MISLKGFVQFASAALMLVFMSGGEIFDYTVVDPSRYNSMGAERVIKNNNPDLATHTIFQGRKCKNGCAVDVYYCGW